MIGEWEVADAILPELHRMVVDPRQSCLWALTREYDLSSKRVEAALGTSAGSND